MDILRGYGLGPNLWRLLQSFWDDQLVVPKAGRYYRRPFRKEIGVTQGGGVSNTVSNVMVEIVVRVVLMDVCRPQEVQHGMGWAAGENNIVLYAKNGHIEACNPIWVYTTLTVVIQIFNRV